jgi:uracil-DNA glycosylase family 4
MTEPAGRARGARSRVPGAARSDCYDPGCTRCPRLAEFLAESHEKYPQYWSRPVPSFGGEDARLLFVGLAPGLHGANATGRPFTGDYAGVLLYQTLHELGLASGPVSQAADDDLKLTGARITNAVKCVPPENKPLPAEIRTCNAWLKAELGRLAGVRVVLAIGRVAHDAVLMAFGKKKSAFPFAHGGEHRLDETRLLVDSYHCSRYNTQTGVLTAAMFKQVVTRALELSGG